MTINRNKKILVLTLIAGGVVALVSFYVGRISVLGEAYLTESQNEERRIKSMGLRFTSPLLECEEHTMRFFKDISSVSEKVEDFIDGVKSRGEISHASVYFRDLSNGPWFGINEDFQFQPASLAKVPLMVTFLKLVEADPSLFNKKLTLSELTPTADQVYEPSVRLEIGKSYSTRELLERMIIFSDNDSLNLLFNSKLVDQEAFDDVYSDFGIDAPTSPESRIDVRSYASFFRILYNATYLVNPLSEYALELLSQTSFMDGLRAQLPKEIVVAHKFGERKTTTGEIQFHDCGIIYYPERPYLLCVMTRGFDTASLVEVIADVSGIIYEEIKARE